MLKALIVAPLAALLLAASPLAAAADPPASEESIRRLLTAMDARALISNFSGVMDRQMEQAMQQAMRGQKPTPQQQKVLDATRKRMVAIMQDVISWETLEPIYLRIYRDNFTQSEVDGMLAFYKSPAGQALTKKMPAAMQSAMTEVQKLMPALMQKMQEAMHETERELREAENASQPKP